MSSQRGNTQRTRPQKHQNRFVFKNDLHDKSHKMKAINNIQVANVCEKCKKIIEWKIKYKKFKPLKAPAKCAKCEQKVVKHAYHIMCQCCARERDVCPKCGIKAELVEGHTNPMEQLKLDAELQSMLKELPERKRRTFIRYMNQKVGNISVSTEVQTELSDKSNISIERKTEKEESEAMHKNLMDKLKSMTVKESLDDCISDLDYSDDNDEDCDSSEKS
ncbi:uncharacterized protein LOC122512079 [Leptopilina heterotoma]|uniref:uncharacterized protein LOC122512079 n=1 Tax=Leptopilina heterotoma TaxID=63436 RepID=UPI001CA93530|nr:uncharacterized protein LOC122512079 [Leptopilina heterotoma]XP_043483642.1 uncharacterized protein LOC122512079 [Leptopilina heterotoma]